MQDTLVSSMSMDGVPELSKTDIGTTRPSPRPLRGLVLVQLCGFFAYAPQTANHQQSGLLAWSALDWKVKASSPSATMAVDWAARVTCPVGPKPGTSLSPVDLQNPLWSP